MSINIPDGARKNGGERKMDCLLADAVTEHIQKQYARFSLIWKQYHRGFYGKDNCLQEIRSVIIDGLFNYQGLPRFNLTQHVWDDFLEEYRMTEQGIPLPVSKNENWLNSTQRGEVNKTWIPASASDRMQALRLIQAFHIPPKYYAPLPDDTPVPHRWRHSFNEDHCINATIPFRCENDEELLSCDTPCGKTFKFKNELGLEAVIAIKDIFPEPKEILHNRASASYLGEGYIEGYTEMSAKRQDPRLYIILSDGRIDGFIAFLSSADECAYRQFPLWQGYFHSQATKNAIFEKVVDDFFESLLRFEGNIPIP